MFEKQPATQNIPSNVTIIVNTNLAEGDLVCQLICLGGAMSGFIGLFAMIAVLLIVASLWTMRIRHLRSITLDYEKKTAM